MVVVVVVGGGEAGEVGIDGVGRGRSWRTAKCVQVVSCSVGVKKTEKRKRKDGEVTMSSRRLMEVKRTRQRPRQRQRQRRKKKKRKKKRRRSANGPEQTLNVGRA